MVIVYCDKCGIRVGEDDLRSGAAARPDETHALCPKCTAAQVPAHAQRQTSALRALSTASHSSSASRSARPADRLPPRPAHETSRSAPATLQPRAAASARNTPRTRSRTMLIVFGIVAVAAIALLAVVVGMKGSASPGEKSAGTRAQPPKSAAPLPRPRDLPSETPKPAALTTPSVTNTAPDPKPAPPPGPPDAPKVENSMEDLRNQIGASRLAEAQAYAKANPDDPGTYRDRLEDLVRTYRSTPAGVEAAKLMAELKIPGDDEPPPNDADWQQAVNLLPLLDPQKDAVKGDWKVEGDKLTVQAAPTARIEIPYEPPEEYDFRVTFVRSSGNEDVNQFLTHAGRSFFWSMGCEKNTGSGFDQVDGQNAIRNRTLVRKENAIENDRSHTSIVQVRKCLLRTWLDGQLVCRFCTGYKNVGMRKDWVLRSDSILGLGAHSSTVTFQSIQLREVTGKGRPTRP